MAGVKLLDGYTLPLLDEGVYPGLHIPTGSPESCTPLRLELGKNSKIHWLVDRTDPVHRVRLSHHVSGHASKLGLLCQDTRQSWTRESKVDSSNFLAAV